MKRIQILILIFSSLFFGCSEEKLPLYDGSNNIYFRVIHSDKIQEKAAFTFASVNENEIVYNISVATTGDTFPVPRSFAFKIEDSYSAEKGRDYDYPEEVIIPAGQAYGSLPITLIRSPYEEDDTIRYIDFQLVPNENFKTDLPFRYQNYDTVDVTRFRLEFSSSLTRPQSFQRFGYFSKEKFQLINKIFSLEPKFWYEDYPNQLPINYYTFWPDIIRDYLKDKIKQGPDAAIKDPSSHSYRGYMVMMEEDSETKDELANLIPDSWPDAPQYK